MRRNKCTAYFLCLAISVQNLILINCMTENINGKLCNCACGLRGRFNRIVGGTDTQQYEQPWVTALWKHEKLYCGATIIANKYVLTAAHCIYSFMPNDIFVYVGAHNIKFNRQEVKSAISLLHHELFDAVSFNNDIGLIKLDKPILYGPKAQPACLPNTEILDYSGVVGLIAGWGKIGENQESSTVLKSVTVPVWPKSKCLHSGYGYKRITNNMMCAGYQDGIFDACQGDSGGPMLHELTSGSVEIIGVISWGRGCARPNYPGIYTIVGNYKLWIEKHLADDCICSKKSAWK